MAKNLVLFSGGADSAYLTYKLLVDTQDEITLLVLAHDQDLCSGLSRKKILSMQPLIAKLRTYRDFKVIYHLVDESKVTSWNIDKWFDYSIVAFANDFNNGVYDKLVSGTTWEQHDIQSFKNSSIRGIRHTITGQKVFDSYITKGQLWNPLVTNDIHDKFNRWHLLKFMPADLMSLVDIDNTKQLYNDKVRQLISEGYTASDVDTWRQEKSREYGGGNRDLVFLAWIHLIDGNSSFFVKKGVATDGVDVNFTQVTTKQECIDWYTTIEYNRVIDYSLVKWGLGKEAFNPES